MQFNQPECWAEENLDNLATFIDYRGKTPVKTNTGVPLITAKNIKDGYINREPREYIALSDYDSWMTRGIPKVGDVLITTEAPMGNVALVDISEVFALAQRAICLQFFYNQMSNYAHYALRCPVFQRALTANSTGTTVSGIKASTLKMLRLPIPPLAEQKVIAEKLDTLLAQVDNTKARLERIPEILKRFRQSVLAAAVSGKLTEEWRGSIDYETKGSKLLPIKWGVEAAKDVCIKVQSGSTPRDNPFDQNGTIPFLKVYNIVNQKIDFDYKPQFVTEDVHKAALKRSIAEPNDILMNIVGPPLGKVAVLTDQYPEWNLNQAITLFRVEPSKLNHLFLYHVLCEGELVREVMPDTKGSVGQVNISLSQCRDALLPVPPLEEQSEIVRRVEELFAFADRIEHAAQAALSRVNNLTQSILAKAFRGELTADWRAANPELISGEHSAEALLERIKAERATSSKKTKDAKGHRISKPK
uniref:Type I restriction-modification system, specificity subunit S n=1 Tax=Rheinheimera sp. BAL341 TaxID=1708203 RepID=A0A486XUU8_9GAMM